MPAYDKNDINRRMHGALEVLKHDLGGLREERERFVALPVDARQIAAGRIRRAARGGNVGVLHHPERLEATRLELARERHGARGVVGRKVGYADFHVPSVTPIARRCGNVGRNASRQNRTS